MKVLIFGSTGFIGLPIAQALVRAGHIVYGQTRSETKAKQLEAEEIIPIIGTEADAWLPLIPTLDVVIEAVGGTANIQVVASTLLQVVTSAAQRMRPAHAPKLTYIYTSGTWVHGDNRNEIVTDTTPITNPPELVAWKPQQEQATTSSTILNGIVVRPGLLYGRSSSLFEPVFKQAREERKVTWAGTPGGRFALIHADDLADLFVRVAEGAGIAGGKIFDAVNSVTEDVDAFLRKLSLVAGLNGGYEYRRPVNAYEVALGTTTLVKPYLGHSLLGWVPRKMGLTDGLGIYYAAYQATL